MLPGGNSTGEIVFGLTNYGSTPFLLNGNDAGSANFLFSAPASSQQGVGQDIFSDPATGRGNGAIIDFSITTAIGGPVEDAAGDDDRRHSVPEPATLWLLGLGLAAVVGLWGYKRETRS